MKCRMCDVELGYVVETYGHRYKVTSINDKEITMYVCNDNKTASPKVTIGRRSQMWVRLIEILPVKVRQIPVIKMDNKGRELKQYPSIREAANDVGIDERSIKNAVLGIYKQAAGFIWKRA